MLNKKMLLSLLVIGVVSVSAGAGTWAYFSDSEISTGNTMEAGTLALGISGSESGVVAWLVNPMAPGDKEDGTITLTNTGDIAADHVEIDFVVTTTNVVTPVEIGSDDIDMSDTMNVVQMKLGGIDLLSHPVLAAADTDSDGLLQLDELNGVSLDDLTPVPAANGGTQPFYMEVELDGANTGNGNQGDSVAIDVTFTLNQDSSQ